MLTGKYNQANPIRLKAPALNVALGLLCCWVGLCLVEVGHAQSPLQRTYLGVVLHQGQKLTWPLGAPLTVTIDGTPQQQALVMQALATWLKAMPQPLQVTRVASPHEAVLRITCQPTLEATLIRQEASNRQPSQALLTAGLTQPRFKNGHLTRVQVSLATTDRHSQPLNNNALYNVALHELGHALGLLGHSPNPIDVMVAERDQDPMGFHRLALSAADVATLQQLYAPQKALEALPASLSPVQQEAQHVSTLNALRGDVFKLDAEARQRPTALNLLNVAQALSALALAYQQQGQGLVAVQLWQQAQQWCSVNQQRHGSRPELVALQNQLAGYLL